jgi:hypothetical protein
MDNFLLGAAGVHPTDVRRDARAGKRSRPERLDIGSAIRGLNSAATTLDYPSVPALQNAISAFCGD